jgi:hypothetical protein
MFRKNNVVRIKKLDEIKKTLDPYRIKVGTEMMFPEEMERWCGTNQKIEKLVENPQLGRDDRVRFSGIGMWAWHFDWLEPIKLDNREVRQHD